MINDTLKMQPTLDSVLLFEMLIQMQCPSLSNSGFSLLSKLCQCFQGSSLQLWGILLKKKTFGIILRKQMEAMKISYKIKLLHILSDILASGQNCWLRFIFVLVYLRISFFNVCKCTYMRVPEINRDIKDLDLLFLGLWKLTSCF